MPIMRANSNIKMASVEAVVTKADGTIENLGVISYYHRNPLRRWAWHTAKAAKHLATRVQKLFN